MSYGRRRWVLAAAALLCLPGAPRVAAAPAFVVSVCLADVEYSIACRERSSLEAARRLEEIFIDDYKTGQSTGSLQIWFPIAASQSEQLRFLREVEDRAIAAALRKMQAGIDNPETPPGYSQPQSPSSNEGSPDQTAADQAQQLAQLLQKRREDIQKWREDATVEARRGSNWSHDWASRTHRFKPGPALQQLVRNANRTRVGN